MSQDPSNPFGSLSDDAPIGQSQSMTIKAAFVGILTVLTVFGVRFTISDADTDKIVLGIGALITLGSFVAAWIGRLRAEKKVVPGAKGLNTAALKRHVKAKLFLLGAIIGATSAGALLSIQTGCATFLRPTTQPDEKAANLNRVLALRQSYTAARDVLTVLIDAGFLDNAQTLDTIDAIEAELDGILDDATRLAKEGNTFGVNDYVNRFLSAFARYMALQQPGTAKLREQRPAAATRPTTRRARHVSSELRHDRNSIGGGIDRRSGERYSAFGGRLETAIE